MIIYSNMWKFFFFAKRGEQREDFLSQQIVLNRICVAQKNSSPSFIAVTESVKYRSISRNLMRWRSDPCLFRFVEGVLFGDKREGEKRRRRKKDRWGYESIR